MSNSTPEQGRVRQTTVVEVVDTSRQRRLLAVVLVLLMIALAAVGWFLYGTTKPAGAPKTSETPTGIEWVRSIYAWGKSPTQMLDSPVDVAVAPNGTIWTVSSKNTLVAFRPDGSARRVVQLTRGAKQGQVASIEGIDVDSNGEVYAADYGNNKVMVFDGSGKEVREWPVQLPVEIAVKDGKVAIAAAFGIGVFDGNGKAIATWGSRGMNKDQVDLPHGITWGEDGNIYVSDTSNKRIKAYTPQGKLLWVYPKSREIAKHSGLGIQKSQAKKSDKSSIQLPAGMTVDAAGRIMFVDPFEFAVISVNNKGVIGKRWGDYGRKDGLFAYPTGIDYDRNRDYYVVADTANNRLQVIKLPGSGGISALASVRRAFDGPIWLCSIPLLLLVAAIVISYRRRREEESTEEPAMGSGEAVAAAAPEAAE